MSEWNSIIGMENRDRFLKDWTISLIDCGKSGALNVPLLDATSVRCFHTSSSFKGLCLLSKNIIRTSTVPAYRRTGVPENRIKTEKY